MELVSELNPVLALYPVAEVEEPEALYSATEAPGAPEAPEAARALASSSERIGKILPVGIPLNAPGTEGPTGR